jgi:hypothetical protein
MPPIVATFAMTETASPWPDPTIPWLLIALAAGIVVGSAGWMGALADTETGMELADVADRRARTWDEDARLVGVNADEHATLASTNHSHESAHDHAEEIGDGQPPAWRYRYQAEDRELTVTVAANGTVLETNEERAGNETPITGWQVTASQAVETAREHGDWDDVDGRWAFYALHRSEPGTDPVWVLGVAGNQTLRVAAVNATTGEHLGTYTPWTGDGWGNWYGWSGSWGTGSANGSQGTHHEASGDQAPQEAGTREGRLTVAEPEETHRFSLDHDGHDELRLALELDRSVWNAVEAIVEGPNGQTTILEASAAEPSDETQIPAPAAGTYTVTVAFEQGPTVLEEGIVQDYEVSWCAPAEGSGT